MASAATRSHARGLRSARSFWPASAPLATCGVSTSRTKAQLEIFEAALRYEREGDGLGFRFERGASDCMMAATACRHAGSPSSRSSTWSECVQSKSACCRDLDRLHICCRARRVRLKGEMGKTSTAPRRRTRLRCANCIDHPWLVFCLGQQRSITSEGPREPTRDGRVEWL